MNPIFIKSYLKLAGQGLGGEFALAQFNLGICYFNGDGVEKDDIESYAYFSLVCIKEEYGQEYREVLEKKLPREVVVRGKQRAKVLLKQIKAKIAAKKAKK